LAPIRLAKAMPCWTAFSASSEPSVGIKMLVYIALSFVIALFAAARRETGVGSNGGGALSNSPQNEANFGVRDITG
jgi:hypothetical protein